MSNTLPHQFRTEAVERYWPYIKLICTTWPTPVVIDPSPFSPETFSCRLRDAIKAIVVHGNGSIEQHELLMPIHRHIMVKQESGKIIAGPREYLRVRKNPTTPGVVIDAKPTLSERAVDSPSESILSAIFVLLSHNIIQHITISNVDEDRLLELIGECKSRPLELVPTSAGTFTIF